VYNPEILLDAKLPNFDNLSTYCDLVFRKDPLLITSSFSYSLLFYCSRRLKNMPREKAIIYLSTYIRNAEFNQKASFLWGFVAGGVS
jgi:hypothetical protein